MLKATFLAHSGFLVELDGLCLLFDWWKGDLPTLPPDKPLLVFASHAHSDHFSPAIFSLDAAAFLLGRDIRLQSLAKKGVASEILEKCLFLRGRQAAEPLSGVTVETLSSTDMGVAFLVTAEGRTIFHAGDLNWWHWAEEPDPWNPNMARNFQKRTEVLRGRKIDLAMLPLDPRMGEDGFRGPKYFLELAEIHCFLPMHQWGDFAFTDKFLARYPQFAAQTVPVRQEGQTFDFF